MTSRAQLLEDLQVASQQNPITLPSYFYKDEMILQLEYDSIFESCWQMVGHTSGLKQSGDQIIAFVGRVPIVIVRNSLGQLNAFHNVCRHRAGPLATKNCNDKVLRCKYHGWTYDLEGQLKAAAEMSTTESFKMSDFSLQQVNVKTWNDFVFVNLKTNKSEFEGLFDTIIETIAPINLTQFEFHHQDVFEIKCNWKVYMDNYLEGYHLPHVHPGLNKMLDYKSYSTTLKKWNSYQHSPIEGQGSFYGSGKAHYYCLFPNMMLNILPNRLQTNLVTPIDKNHTKVVFDYYYNNMNSSNVQQMIAEDKEFSDQVQNEDIEICERVQVGLESGSYDKGLLCNKREAGVMHFQNLVRESIRSFL